MMLTFLRWEATCTAGEELDGPHREERRESGVGAEPSGLVDIKGSERKVWLAHTRGLRV